MVRQQDKFKEEGMRTFFTIGLLLIIAVISNCRSPGPKAKTKYIQSVTVVTAKRNTVTRTVELLGSVYGDRQAMALSKLTGKVTEIVKSEGAYVKEGEPILYVINDIPGMDYKPGPVLAPISGIVGKIYVEVGQSVALGTPIATVTSYSEKVKIKANISDQDLSFVQIGVRATISVSAYPDVIFEGKVTQFSPMLDPISKAATVEVTVINKNKRLIPGMVASVRLILEQKKDVIALPIAALFTDGFSKVCVVENNIVHFREIKVGLIGDELVEVISGIKDGEKVITTGKERVKDGETVKPLEGFKL